MSLAWIVVKSGLAWQGLLINTPHGVRCCHDNFATGVSYPVLPTLSRTTWLAVLLSFRKGFGSKLTWLRGYCLRSVSDMANARLLPCTRPCFLYFFPPQTTLADMRPLAPATRYEPRADICLVAVVRIHRLSPRFRLFEQPQPQPRTRHLPAPANCVRQLRLARKLRKRQRIHNCRGTAPEASRAPP